jgi:hypothetical protein
MAEVRGSCTVFSLQHTIDTSGVHDGVLIGQDRVIDPTLVV